MMELKQSFKRAVKGYYLDSRGKRFACGVGCAWVGRNDWQKKVELTEEHIQRDLLMLKAAYEAGFKYFDTSVMYGESEIVVGRFVETVPRESIFLATKSDKLPVDMPPEEAAAQVRSNLMASLERLRTSYIDLYQIHEVYTLANILPEGGVMEVLQDAKKRGIIRYFGITTRNLSILEEAARFGVFDSVLSYGDYTPVDRPAAKLIDITAKYGVGMINASPLLFGLLTGKDPREVTVHAKDEIRKKRAIALYDLCKAYNIPILAVALQFSFLNPNVDILLTGPANPDEVKSTIEALHVEIKPEFWAEWEELYKTYKQI